MQRIADITVMILAGGLGIRLRSVFSDRPKVLAEILGQPFLTYLLEQLLRAGAREVILCTGYMADRVQEIYGDTYKSLHLLYSQEDGPLDTGGALRLALPLLKSDPVLIMNGDSYIHVDLNSYVEWFLRMDRIASLVLTRVSDTGRYGIVKVKKDGGVLAFEEKGVARGTGWINAGVYLVKTSLLSSIPQGKAFSLEREFFPSLVGKGLFGYQCKGKFIDIGTPESYRTAENFFSDSKIESYLK